MHDTPLGQVVRIRSENDKDIIKNFGAYEKRIRTDWTEFRNARISEKFTEQDKLDATKYFEKLFSGMFGGGDK